MRTVFFDVDTQLDFVYPAGALYVPGAEDVVPALCSLTAYARQKNIPIISTADAHAEDDPEFKQWKPHCVVGTVGQQKCSATLAMAQPAVLSSRPGATVAPAAQTIVEKQHVDCFTNPNLTHLLESLRAERYVVYGVVTEVCVSYAIFGLLKTGADVVVVTDAIRHLVAETAAETIEKFQLAGGKLTTAREAVAK
jgi:nicotinamidase/pyrazinamidase